MTSTMRRPRLRVLMLGGFVALAFAVCGAAAPGAQAATVFTCAGSAVAGFSPGITNTAATVTITDDWHMGPCVNLAAPLELRTGLSTASYQVANLSCTSLDNGSSGTRTIHWSTGTSSTYTYNQTTTAVAGVGLVTVQNGTITSGDFAGDAMLTEEVLAEGQFANCPTSGVTGASGMVEMTIAG
jgi:hypothetical protein